MSKVLIHNSTFKKCITNKGLILITINQDLHISNSTFESLIGVHQSSLLFIIQNEGQHVLIENSMIRNCISKSSLMQLTFGTLKLVNTSVYGAYADLSANVLSMISSQALIIGSLFDN